MVSAVRDWKPKPDPRLIDPIPQSSAKGSSPKEDSGSETDPDAVVVRRKKDEPGGVTSSATFANAEEDDSDASLPIIGPGAYKSRKGRIKRAAEDRGRGGESLIDDQDEQRKAKKQRSK